jgi:hypothetical protein
MMVVQAIYCISILLFYMNFSRPPAAELDAYLFFIISFLQYNVERGCGNVY